MPPRGTFRGREDEMVRLEAALEASLELARGVGLGGRPRRAGSHAERARVNVTQTIRDAIRKIAHHDPSLGRLLATTIKTGTFCSYTPDPRIPVRWSL